MTAKIAVLGAGPWGRNHVKTLFELGALAAVVESERAAHPEIEKRAPGVPIFTSLEVNELRKLDVQGVVVATPVATHSVLGSQLLQEGFDVLVEKPMALTAIEAEKLVVSAEKYARVLMVGHMLLFQPAIQFLRQQIVAGQIGMLRSVHARRRNFGRVRQVENALWSLGVHDVAVLLNLIGALPESVQAIGQWPLGRSVADDVHVHMRFPQDVTCVLHNSWLWPDKDRGLVLIGSEGMYTYNEDDQRVSLSRKSVSNSLDHLDRGTEVVFEGAAEPLRLELEHFIGAISSRHASVATGESALGVTRVLEDAQRQLDAQYQTIKTN
jgi:predicted dehydrogenase